MSKSNDSWGLGRAPHVRELRDDELQEVSGGGAFIANASHTSMSEAAEALKAVAQK